jgi:hypothetical protein
MPHLKIENVLQPGKTYFVDAEKFEAMRKAYLAQVPKSGTGATPAELLIAVIPTLPHHLFPAGDKAGWWAKAVQLDQEAKGVIRRTSTGAVRLVLA